MSVFQEEASMSKCVINPLKYVILIHRSATIVFSKFLIHYNTGLTMEFIIILYLLARLMRSIVQISRGTEAIKRLKKKKKIRSNLYLIKTRYGIF